MHPPDRVGCAALGMPHRFNSYGWRLGMEPRQCKFHRGAREIGASDVPFAVSDAWSFTAHGGGVVGNGAGDVSGRLGEGQYSISIVTRLKPIGIRAPSETTPPLGKNEVVVVVVVVSS